MCRPTGDCSKPSSCGSTSRPSPEKASPCGRAVAALVVVVAALQLLTGGLSVLDTFLTAVALAAAAGFTHKREHAVAFNSMLRRRGIRVTSITEHADFDSDRWVEVDAASRRGLHGWADSELSLRCSAS